MIIFQHSRSGRLTLPSEILRSRTPLLMKRSARRQHRVTGLLVPALTPGRGSGISARTGDRIGLNDQRAASLNNSIIVMNASDGSGRHTVFGDPKRNTLAALPARFSR